MKIEFAASTIACVYERERCHLSSRDRLIFYKDGNIKFESYCYGEAATLTFSCFSAGGMTENGELLWPNDLRPPRDCFPPTLIKELCYDSFYVEDKPFVWKRIEERKTDKENGYGFFKSLKLKL